MEDIIYKYICFSEEFMTNSENGKVMAEIEDYYNIYE